MQRGSSQVLTFEILKFCITPDKFETVLETLKILYLHSI